MINTLARYKLHHVLFWVCYFIFWVALYRDMYQVLFPLLINTTIYTVYNASGFYIAAYWLVPRYLYQNRTSRFIFLTISLVLILGLGIGITQYLFFGEIILKYYTHFGYLLIGGISANVFTVGLLLSVKLLVDKARNDRKDRDSEKERLETELQFLKAQVNPHFLFNSINSIYVLIKKDPNLAAETLIRLSDLLRLQLYEFGDQKIPIEKEIDYIRNFIALEQLRKGNTVAVNIKIDEHIKGFQLAPFLILPFLENAFKYVSSGQQKKKEIDIELAYDGSAFFLKVFNTYDPQIAVNQGGLGLKNLRRRLELLYPQKHTLSLDAGADYFEAKLQITLSTP